MEQPQLVIIDRNGTRSLGIPVGSMVIGRSGSADIGISSDYVSRRHAQLTWDGSVLELTDLGSSNGTTVNGTRVVQPVDLADGDQIRLGDAEVKVLVPAGDASTRILLQSPSAPRAVNSDSYSRRPRTAGSSSVFVSYARTDHQTAQRFVGHLRSRGWHVLIDEDILQPGEVWNQSIAEEITRCDVVLVLISPASAGSSWVNQELVAAINARRPVLPVVIDSYNIGEARRRFALLGDRQWLMFDNPAGPYDPVELDDVAHHLERLAAGSRPDRTVTRRERLGSILMWIGIIGLIATIGWYAIGFVRVGGSFLEFVTAGSGAEPGGSFDEVERAFAEYAGGITGLFVTFPIAFASIVAIIWGVVIRRRARKQRLMGR